MLIALLSSGSIRTVILLTLSSITYALILHGKIVGKNQRITPLHRRCTLLPVLSCAALLSYATYLNAPFRLSHQGIANIRALDAEMKERGTGIGSLAIGSGFPFVWHYWSVNVTTYNHTFWMIKKREMVLSLFVIAASAVALFALLRGNAKLTLMKLLLAQFCVAVLVYLHLKLGAEYIRIVATVVIVAPLIVYFVRYLPAQWQSNRVPRSTRRAEF